MIKNFETYINEDYFSKLASRKDNGITRKENEVTLDVVNSVIDYNESFTQIKSIDIRKENGHTFVDIVGDVRIKGNIEEIPFQFGKVTGRFCCSCCELTSLKGCPQEVTNTFFCSDCPNLTSLDGCPKRVGGQFQCEKCGKEFTIKEVKSLCKVMGGIFVV